MLRRWCGLWLMLSIGAAAQPGVRVVTELSPPHQTLQDGKVAGLSTSLVEAVLADAGVQATIEMYPWARSLRIARSQPNVLIYNMARTAEREHEFHWIGKIAAYQLGFVTLSHRHDVQINNLTAARKYTIAVQRDDLAANFLMAQGFMPGRQLVLAAGISESWQLLLNGKVDLVIDDPVALNGMAATLQIAPDTVRFVYAIPQLAQQTWLAASLSTPTALVKQLQQAHSRVASSELYHAVMTSSYQAQKEQRPQ